MSVQDLFPGPSQGECVLAGDIGGTKTNLGFFIRDQAELKPLKWAHLSTRTYPSAYRMLKEFLTQCPLPVAAASVGIACPIVNGRCETPNLPWTVSVAELKHELGLEHISLINDLEATALGIAVLPETAFAALNAGAGVHLGCRAVMAAGTGLGEAALIWNGQTFQVLPSEGGHGDFAPRSDLEWNLCRYLIRQFGHASCERVLSGPGLHNIYNFLRDDSRLSEPAWLTNKIVHGDPNEIITQVALDGRDPICRQALDLFISIWGAEAGNLALHFFATGGVYLAGGIAPNILTLLQGGAFLKSFSDKGRLSSLMSAIPIQVILEPRAALFGAAHLAFSMLSKEEFAKVL